MPRLRTARWLAAVCFAAALVSPRGAALAQSGAETDDPELESRARALEGRIIAPCCWTQTIDVHASEIAQELRHEIRQRLRAGESTDAIEADFVARYGERIRSVQPDSPLGTIATVALVSAFLAGGLLFFFASKWRKRGPPGGGGKEARGDASAAGEAGAGDEWDERLDAELRDA